MHNVIIEDTTLRDGEQSPGVALSKEKKLKIFHSLVDVGVRWIEVGIPAMGGEEVRALQAMLEYRDEINIIGWNRGVEENINQSLALGFKALHIGLPTSTIHLQDSMGKGQAWLIQAAVELVSKVKDAGAFLSISAEDVGRTDRVFLQDYAGAVAEAGADRIRLSDTIGILDSEGYARQVSAVRQATDLDIQTHCHNDFGLAVANTLAGLKAGAKYFHVCVNGMGERAGMPDLAVMAMALKQFHGVDLGLETQKLTELSRLVSELTGVEVEPHHPVVGRNVFAHESGIHTNGMLKNAKTFEPFSPEETGGTRQLLVGKHSGRNMVKQFLEQEGISPLVDLLPSCLEHVRQTSIDLGRNLTHGEVKSIYLNLSGSLVAEQA